MLLILNVIYVFLAIGMTAMILMQRGSGAQAGAGFGGGASATVFGSRGASSFLSKSTKWMAITFFSISLFMAWYATHGATPVPAQQDLGIMAQVPAAPAPAPGNATIPAAPVSQQPAAPTSTVPVAPAQAPPPTTATPAPEQALPAPATESQPAPTNPGG